MSRSSFIWLVVLGTVKVKFPLKLAKVLQESWLKFVSLWRLQRLQEEYLHSVQCVKVQYLSHYPPRVPHLLELHKRERERELLPGMNRVHLWSLGFNLYFPSTRSSSCKQTTSQFWRTCNAILFKLCTCTVCDIGKSKMSVIRNAKPTPNVALIRRCFLVAP